MDDIIKSYNSCGDCELEYKLRISYNRFADLYNQLLSKSTEKCVTTTVNFIDKHRNIRQVLFRIINNNENREENIYNKQKLNEIKSDNYKLSLSREKTVSKFDQKNINVIRIKLRSSLIVDDWSYDFTVSRQLSKESIAIVPSIVAEFKKINNPNSFTSDIEYLLSDSQLEFEIEYVGGHDIDINDINKPLTIIDMESSDIIYQEILFKTAQLIQPKKAEFFKQRLGYKHLSKQVKGLTKEFYVENYKKLLVTDKLDGERATILLQHGKMYLFGSKIFKTQDFSKKYPKDTIIIDGEYHIESDTFYSFEVPYFNKRMSNEDSVSDKLLQKVHKMLKNHKIKTILKNTPENINKLTHEIKTYETDGLIFIDPSTGISYKWKPVNKSTIDFLIKKIPAQLLGKEPYIKKNGLNTYVLMVGITYQDFEKYMIGFMPQYNKIIPITGKYFPIQFSPPNCPYCHVYYSKDELDGQIGEFLWNENEEWELIKIREDRVREASKGTYFGNNYAIAEEIWMYLSAPISIDFLMTPSLTQYFKKSDPMLLPQRNYNRFVRHYLYEQYKGDNIIDLASGQGQGLNAIMSNYKQALMIDIDADALVELRRRVRESTTTNKTRIFTQQLDLNDDFRKNLIKLKKINFPNVKTIVCHFAIHYMLSSDTLAKNFLCFINNLSVKDTNFIFTAYDGKKIFALPDNFEIKNGSRIKYKIVKKYKSNKLENTGQKIDVLLPFSDGELYEENLVNIDYITKLMRQLKFKLVMNRPFSHLFEQYKAHNKSKYDELSDDDKKYLDLYSFVVYQKQ